MAPRVFTSLVARRDPGGVLSVPALSGHLARLESDARAFDLAPSELLLLPHIAKETLREAFLSTSIRSLRLRLVVHSGGIDAFCDPFIPRFPSGTAALKSVRAHRPHAGHKTTGTWVSARADSLARESGADEALLLDADGRVLEGAWSSFFWLDARSRFCTREDGVLPGIVRKLLLSAEAVRFEQLSVKKILSSARGCFVANSVQGIVPVRAIDSTPISPAAVPVLRLSRILAATEERISL